MKRNPKRGTPQRAAERGGAAGDRHQRRAARNRHNKRATEDREEQRTTTEPRPPDQEKRNRTRNGAGAGQPQTARRETKETEATKNTPKNKNKKKHSTVATGQGGYPRCQGRVAGRSPLPLISVGGVPCHNGRAVRFVSGYQNWLGKKKLTATLWGCVRGVPGVRVLMFFFLTQIYLILSFVWLFVLLLRF